MKKTVRISSQLTFDLFVAVGWLSSPSLYNYDLSMKNITYAVLHSSDFSCLSAMEGFALYIEVHGVTANLSLSNRLEIELKGRPKSILIKNNE